MTSLSRAEAKTQSPTIVGVLTVIVLAGILALDHATVQLAQGDGLLEVLRASLFWLIYVSLSLWLARRVWAALGPTVREFLCARLLRLRSLLWLSALSLLAAIPVSYVMHLLEKQRAEAEVAARPWHVPHDPSGLYYRTVTFDQAAGACTAGQHLASADELAALWPRLRGELHGSYWTATQRQGGVQLFEAKGDGHALAWVTYPNRGEAMRLPVVCLKD